MNVGTLQSQMEAVVKSAARAADIASKLAFNLAAAEERIAELEKQNVALASMLHAAVGEVQRTVDNHKTLTKVVMDHIAGR